MVMVDVPVHAACNRAGVSLSTTPPTTSVPFSENDAPTPTDCEGDVVPTRQRPERRATATPALPDARRTSRVPDVYLMLVR